MSNLVGPQPRVSAAAATITLTTAFTTTTTTTTAATAILDTHISSLSTPPGLSSSSSSPSSAGSSIFSLLGPQCHHQRPQQPPQHQHQHQHHPSQLHLSFHTTRLDQTNNDPDHDHLGRAHMSPDRPRFRPHQHHQETTAAVHDIDRLNSQRSQLSTTSYAGRRQRAGADDHLGYSPHERHHHSRHHTGEMETNISSFHGTNHPGTGHARTHSGFLESRRFHYADDARPSEQTRPQSNLSMHEEHRQEQGHRHPLHQLQQQHASVSWGGASPLRQMGSGSSPDLEAAVPQEQYASKGRAQASNSSRPVAAWSPSFPSSSTGPDSESSRHSFTNDNGDAVPPTADTRHPPCTAKSPLRHSTLTATPSPTSTALPPSSSTASTTGARSLSVLNRSSLRNEITSPDSSFSFPSSSSSPSSFSTGFSPRPALPSSITAVLAKASPSPGFAAPHISSSSLLHSATVGANSSAATADKAEMPALMSSSPSNHDLCYEGSHDRNHDSGGHVNETGGTVGSYDQATGADKGSTFVSDAQPRRGPIRSMVKTEEDQEAPRAAAVGTARQGGESGIMGASAYHANDATAGPSAIGETAEGGTGGAAGAGAGAGARARAGAGAGAGAGAESADFRHSQYPHQHRHSELHQDSPPPPACQQQQTYLGHQSESSAGSYCKQMKGSSAPSFPSSTAPPPVTAGAPGTTASVHRAPSPPMNNHPLPFDQTGQTPHFHHAFHSDPNTPSDGGMGGPALNNKRRSIADSLFVPTKSVKVKEKRNSGSASSISSVESYRQDEGINSEHHSLAGWTSHPKSASSTSTSSDGSASVLPAQRMSLEPQQASPSARRPSTAKASGRAAGGSAPSPKTFQCTGYPGCNMVFTRSEHLARHERKHTGEKPYKCIVANCPRTFSRYDNMIQHTQTHGDRTKRDSLAAAAAAGNASRARSSSLHSNPFLTGRPRGGSSPVVFGSGYDDLNYRSLQNSPASSYIAHSSAFSQQQRHPYSPHYQQLQQYSHQQQHQNQQHPVHLKFPDGTPAMSSHPSMASRTNGSIDSIGNIYGGDSQSYPPESGPSTPVIRTLKANSRSLPHLQPRSSSIVTADSPSMGLQQSMSGMEIEEFKRRKSEVLFPLSFSEDRVAAGSAYGHAQGLGQGQGQGIGLGMSSPLTPAASHTQPLPHVEKLSPQEQERLIEHRRSAQAILCRTGPGAGLRGQRGTYESFSEQGPLAGAQEGVNSGPESIGIGPPPPHVQHLSTLKKERLLEHRKSTPELMYDAMKAKRSSNDPTDMNVLPLPSRDSRSGVQWFSQINTPSIPSFPLPLTSRDAHGGGPAAISSGRRRVVTLGSSAAHSGEGAADISSPTILPPILGTYDERHDDRLTRPRALSGHIHPLAHHDRVGSSGFVWQPLSNDEGSNTKDRSQFDPTLSPRMERYLEERYYPIQKREVLDAIERMDVREFLGLKAQVAGSYASEQFRNPEFLGNMAALLCIIRAPHPFWKSARPKRSSGGSIESGSEGAAGISRRQSYKDMGVDNVEPMDVDEQGTMMDVKKDGSRANGRSAALEQPCRFALDIDMDSFGRDPEPELRSIEGLTINSLFPTKSFVAGFEPAMMMDHRKESNAEEDEGLPRSVQGYPSNARIGRFYLPERAFRTPESLQFQPDPSGPWVCCRFEEYLGVSIWVLGSVLEKYRELAQRYKMALTLMGEEETLEMQNRAATFDHDDEWEIRTGEQYDVKVKESTLYPEMVQQVWKDMYQQYHHQHQQQQYQQHQPPHRPSSQLLSQQQQAAVPPHMTNRVATYEEYQKSRWQAADSRRESYPALLPSSSAAAHHYDDHYYQGEYHPQSQYQQQHRLPQNAHQSYINHCEDLSSGPSSPNSVHQDDCFQEDVQSNDSAASTPRQHYRHHQNQDQNQNHPYHYQEGSSNPSASGSSGDANMHRRISIAELCNPMQSLATARERDY